MDKAIAYDYCLCLWLLATSYGYLLACGYSLWIKLLSSAYGYYFWLLAISYLRVYVVTLALGSWPGQGVERLRAKEEDPKVTSHAFESAKNVREWTFTLTSELPCWELESQKNSQTFKVQLQGQNFSPWNVFYIIGKLLKLRCLIWARITHLVIFNTSYDQKKGQESNWQFDSQPLKVKNQPNSLACRQRTTYCWKALDKGYNFALNFIAIRSLHKKLCALKVARVPVVGILGLPLGNPGTKNHLNVAPVERRKVYYKGEGGGFPQVRAMVNLVCLSCLSSF